VRAQASLSNPGYLVLVDTFDPGWRVRVDGHPATLLRANIAFRAVLLPPGTHEVTFLYRPWSVGLGLTLSATGLALGTWGLFSRRGPE
jgi:uncharacterized membrane protein YfhO